MGPVESHACSFVVKIWLEETVQESGKAIWRGHITHVPSGARTHLKTPEDIIAFIAPYLQQMGVRLCPAWRIKQWFRAHRLLPARQRSQQ